LPRAPLLSCVFIFGVCLVLLFASKAALALCSLSRLLETLCHARHL